MQPEQETSSGCQAPQLQIMVVASPRNSLQQKLNRYNSCGAAIVWTRFEPATAEPAAESAEHAAGIRPSVTGTAPGSMLTLGESGLSG